MNENYSIPTHGGMIAMGLAFRRSRLNCEFMVANGEPSYIDMAEVTNRTFDEPTTTTVGGGLVWYLEVLRVADFITIAPAFGVGYDEIYRIPPVLLIRAALEATL